MNVLIKIYTSRNVRCVCVVEVIVTHITNNQLTVHRVLGYFPFKIEIIVEHNTYKKQTKTKKL